MIFRFPFGSAPHPPSLEDRAVGAYLGVAVGDALGATLEFMTPREIQAEYGVHKAIKGGGWLHLKRGAVTDDTEMSLALGKAILETGRVEALPAAQAFDDWMRTKPIDIGHTVRRGLVGFRNNGTLESPESEYAAGNGACMRALPVALALLGAEAGEVRAANRLQAHITHNNPLSDAGTECVIAMVQAALSGTADREALAALAHGLVAEHKQFRFDKRRLDNPSPFIVHTLKAVFQAVLEKESFEDTIIDVVNRGGDADTTGAIAGMIAGALYGRHAIPRRWLRRLDKDVRQACEKQARALLKLGRAPEPAVRKKRRRAAKAKPSPFFLTAA